MPKEGPPCGERAACGPRGLTSFVLVRGSWWRLAPSMAAWPALACPGLAWRACTGGADPLLRSLPLPLPCVAFTSGVWLLAAGCWHWRFGGAPGGCGAGAPHLLPVLPAAQDILAVTTAARCLVRRGPASHGCCLQRPGAWCLRMHMHMRSVLLPSQSGGASLAWPLATLPCGAMQSCQAACQAVVLAGCASSCVCVYCVCVFALGCGNIGAQPLPAAPCLFSHCFECWCVTRCSFMPCVLSAVAPARPERRPCCRAQPFSPLPFVECLRVGCVSYRICE